MEKEHNYVKLWCSSKKSEKEHNQKSLNFVEKKRRMKHSKNTPVLNRKQHFNIISKRCIATRLNLLHPKYLEPFQYGWRREVVYRTDGKTKDIYYVHPNGKRLRSLREVSDCLTPGLTINEFSFSKETLGASPVFEIIRTAVQRTPKLQKEFKTTTSFRRRSPKSCSHRKTSRVLTEDKSSSILKKLKIHVDTAERKSPVIVLHRLKMDSILSYGTKQVSARTEKTLKVHKVANIKEPVSPKTKPSEEFEIGMLPPSWEPVRGECDGTFLINGDGSCTLTSQTAREMADYENKTKRKSKETGVSVLRHRRLIEKQKKTEEKMQIMKSRTEILENENAKLKYQILQLNLDITDSNELRERINTLEEENQSLVSEISRMKFRRTTNRMSMETNRTVVINVIDGLQCQLNEMQANILKLKNFTYDDDNDDMLELAELADECHRNLKLEME